MKASSTGLYGLRQAQSYRLDKVESFGILSARNQFLALTHMHSPNGVMTPTPPSPREKAFLIPVHLRLPDSSRWQTWVDGKPEPAEVWEEGGIGIFDLEAQPTALRNSSFETVHYYLPRATLNSFTDEEDLPRVETLSCEKGKRDHVMFHLSQAVLPALREPTSQSGLYWDSFLSMICGHLVANYGSAPIPNISYKGGLAPWQKRTVLEYINENLGEEVRIGALAEQCGLSSGHLARSFKRSFGTTVHEYLTLQRVAKAKELLKGSRMSLLEISMQTGFCDQAAFCRTFGKAVGATPSRWRKNLLSHDSLTKVTAA